MLKNNYVYKTMHCRQIPAVGPPEQKPVDKNFWITKTVFLLIIFGNRKRWNRGIVNGMQHVLGIGRTGRVFHLFNPREWNSWKSRNNWNSDDRFG